MNVGRAGDGLTIHFLGEADPRQLIPRRRLAWASGGIERGTFDAAPTRPRPIRELT
jgi:hypothetical protein